MQVKVKIPENRVGEFLDKFERESTMTYEGLSLSDDMTEMENYFREYGYDKEDFILFYTDGKTVSDYYSLTGDNRYPDDLTIVFVPDYYDIKIKVTTGARWFDDIVLNNRMREHHDK